MAGRTRSAIAGDIGVKSAPCFAAAGAASLPKNIMQKTGMCHAQNGRLHFCILPDSRGHDL
jgi:hypothetical protein